MIDDVPSFADWVTQIWQGRHLNWTTPTLVGCRFVDDDADFDDVPFFLDWATQDRDGRHLVESGDYADLVRRITPTLAHCRLVDDDDNAGFGAFQCVLHLVSQNENCCLRL